MSAVRSLLRSLIQDKRPSIALFPETEYYNEVFSNVEADFHYFGKDITHPNFKPIVNSQVGIDVSFDAAVAYTDTRARDFARFWHIPCIQIVDRGDLKEIFGDLVIYTHSDFAARYNKTGFVIPPTIDENFTTIDHDLSKKLPIIIADIEHQNHMAICKAVVHGTRLRINTVIKDDKRKRFEQYEKALCFLSLNSPKHPYYAIESRYSGLPVISIPNQPVIKEYSTFQSENTNDIKNYIKSFNANTFKKKSLENNNSNVINNVMEFAKTYVRTS